MKLVIYKYELIGNKVEVPKTSHFLKLINQREHAVAYFMVDPDPIESEKKIFEFKGIVTGQQFDPKGLIGWEYITTLSFESGNYIEHFFMREWKE